MAAVSLYCRYIDGSSVATVPEVRVELRWFVTATQPAHCSRIAAVSMIWVVILVLLGLFLAFVDTRRPDNYPPVSHDYKGGHDSPDSTPRSPADVDEGVHYAATYSTVGMARSVVIADAPDDHVGAGLRPTEKPLRQPADTAVQGWEA
uniref:(California timema) hypothetical protein n=1 Tax=Timema californicum TaxID=61474 RepID=A0A7R9JAR3_TIMCA|nr:unnamed protein product [Timema californicum]